MLNLKGFPRRLKKLYVAEHAILTALLYHPNDVTEDRYLSLPPDTQVVDVFHSPEHSAYCYILSNNDWPEVPYNQDLPTLNAESWMKIRVNTVNFGPIIGFAQVPKGRLFCTENGYMGIKIGTTRMIEDGGNLITVDAQERCRLIIFPQCPANEKGFITDFMSEAEKKQQQLKEEIERFQNGLMGPLSVPEAKMKEIINQEGEAAGWMLSSMPDNTPAVNFDMVPSMMINGVKFKPIEDEKEPQIVDSKDCKKLCPKCDAILDYYIYKCPKCGYDWEEQHGTKDQT